MRWLQIEFDLITACTGPLWKNFSDSFAEKLIFENHRQASLVRTRWLPISVLVRSVCVCVGGGHLGNEIKK
jgi:hypothetical protein